jgi:hypothetical protein
MNEHNIKQNTRLYYLPEPHRTVLESAVATLINGDGEGYIKVSKHLDLEGKQILSIEVHKTP